MLPLHFWEEERLYLLLGHFHGQLARALATNGCSLAMQRVPLAFLEIESVSEAESDSSEEAGTFLECFSTTFCGALN